MSSIPVLERFRIAGTDRHPVHASLIRFALDGYDLSQFDACGIACPPAIVRSVQKRQAEFLYGRLAARGALLAIGMPSLHVGTGASREPLWPDGVIGSITHGHGYAAAVALHAGRYRGVGIDIEAIASGESLRALMATALDEDELASLRAFGSEVQLPMRVTLAFSAKEAFFKAAFNQVGRYFDFSALRLLAIDEKVRQLTFEVREQLSGALSPGRVLSLEWGYLDAETLHTACML